MGQQNPFDQFDGIFGGPPSKFQPAEEKGVAWEAKAIGAKLYVPLEQVLELLKNNAVLPKMQERLTTHIANQAARTRMDI